MKVLQINSVCGYGSTGNIAVDLYRELKAQGHEGCIAYGRGTAPSDIESHRIGSNLDVYMHGAFSRLTDRHGFYSTKATKDFVKWMKEYNPDIIHLHNLHGYYINVEILFKALKEMGKPVIWTLHDCWAFTGHCSHFAYVGCEKWKTQCKHCPQKKDYPASFFLDNSYKNYLKKKKAFTSLDADKLIIVTPSEWLESLVKESVLQKYDLKTIHNGIDINVFHPSCKHVKERYGLSGKKIILSVASEWTKTKGIQDFIKLSDMIDDDWQIVLIGHINGKTLEKSNITYIDRTSDKDELVSWYTEADVFFNPTYQDTFPTVNLEAQACGTPVITYDTGGSPEGLDKSSGFVCAQGDLKEVVAILPNIEKTTDIVVSHEKTKQYKQYLNLYELLGNKT